VAHLRAFSGDQDWTRRRGATRRPRRGAATADLVLGSGSRVGGNEACFGAGWGSYSGAPGSILRAWLGWKY
jgi:hypothetical protein